MLCLLRIQWLTVLALTTGAMAGGPIPAVDLPAAVPDFVREQTARTLASTRDTLGWTVHPFRGEFHGLGTPAGGSTAAYDLSANGRVVVGADVNSAGGSEAFVWSPWTGRATYNMRPPGVTGNVTATTISANGVYVAGNVGTAEGDEAFRWSLASREAIPSPGDFANTAVALSGDGQFVVGTNNIRRPFTGGCSLVNDDGICTPVLYLIADVPTQAYRYSPSGGLESLPILSSYREAAAVDVSTDGLTAVSNNGTGLSSGIFSLERGRVREPSLWTSDAGIRGLGSLDRGTPLLDESWIFQTQTTEAKAISADGNAVVGVDSVYTTSSVITHVWPPARSYPSVRAVLWREETGWVDLGSLPSTPDRHSRGAEATGVSGDGSLVVGNASFQIGPDYEITGSGTFRYLPATNIPFLWDEQRGMRELADVLSLDYGLEFGGWSLDTAAAISDDGTTIIGNGTNPDGDSEAWRAVLDRGTPDGDLDFDGDVDHLDYQTLAANLGLDSDTDAVFYADGDLNADGRVDQEDSDAFLSRYEHRWMGDFNADGLVDLADYTFWRDREGLFTGGLADSNGDGWVNQTDLAAWQTHFGMAIEAIRAQAVPEPTALAGLCAALLLAAGRRQRGYR